jgi:TRAP-type C4-dicarboxylate transport system permease small subunit
MYSASLLIIPQGIIIHLLASGVFALIIWLGFKLFKKDSSFKFLFKLFSFSLVIPYILAKILFNVLMTSSNAGQIYIVPMVHFFLILIFLLVLSNRKKKLTIHD